MGVRAATAEDASRIAEILVYNIRLNYWPIFGDVEYPFITMQVVPVAREMGAPEPIARTLVYEDGGVVKGFARLQGSEIEKLYVDPFFQGQGVGAALLRQAVKGLARPFVWALEKNVRALRFYEREGFARTGERALEEGTTEYIVRLERP